MDFGNAALLSLLVFVVVAAVDQVVALPSKVKIPLAFLIGIGAVLLVRETVWAHEQVVGGKALDQLNAASAVVAGIFLGALATGIDQGLKAVKNIGANQ